MSPLRYILLSSLALLACSPKPAADTAASLEQAQASTESAAPEPGAAPRRPCALRFPAFDANGDQRVSLDEFLAQPHRVADPERMFQARDLNSDGALTLEELCAGGPGGARAAGCDCPLRESGPGVGRGGGQGRGRGLGARCDERVARFDADADGAVSEREFLAQPHPHGDPHAMFAARDRDGDGVLAREELCELGLGGATAGDAGAPGCGCPAGCHCPPGAGTSPGPMGPGGRGRGAGPGGGRLGGAQRGGVGAGPGCDARLARFDADGDGSVSEREFSSQPHPRGDAAALFTERDRDGDGKLTREELCAPLGRAPRQP